MQRKVTFSLGEFYHLYNRGVDKRKIFINEKDYFRFLILLRICNSRERISIRDLTGIYSFNELMEKDFGEPLVSIGAYCLMPNHFHLLITPIQDDGISLFMLKLQTGYSMYFNKKYERSGSLFQGIFKSEHVNKDGYLKYLFAYIHLNPVKLVQSNWREEGIRDLDKVKNYLEKFWYSSFQEYTGIERPESKILSKDKFPDYFSEELSFKKFIQFWLEYKN
jgi:putative transposase